MVALFTMPLVAVVWTDWFEQTTLEEGLIGLSMVLLVASHVVVGIALSRSGRELAESNALAGRAHFRYELGASRLQWRSRAFSVAADARFGTALHPDDRDALDRAMDSASGADGSLTLRVRIEAEDASWRTFELDGRCTSRGRTRVFVGVAHDLSSGLEQERARADLEEKVRVSEERHRAIFENAFTPIGLIDEHGKLVAANTAYEALLGYRTGELNGVYQPSLAHPDDLPPALESFRAVIAGTRDAFRMQMRFRHRGGDYVSTDFCLSGVKDASSRVHSCVVTATDITRRVEAEAQLTRSEGEMRSLFAVILDLVLVLGGDGRVLSVAPTSPEGLHRHVSRLTGRTLSEIFPKATAETMLAQVAETLRSGKALEFEASIPVAEEAIWLWATAYPLPGGRVGIVARDITARKRAEAKAVENARFLQALIDALPDPMFYKGTDRRFAICNRAYAVGRGLPATSIVGHTTEEVWGPEIAAKGDPADDAIFRDGKVETYEMTAADASGAPVQVLARKAPFRDSSGRIVGIIGTLLDITSQAAAQRALRDAVAAAEGATRAKSEFLANMSHEIRTPMNAILGMTELLSETPLSETQSQYVTTCRTAGEALLTLINEILDLSKIEANRMTLERVPFDLRETIEEVVSLMSAAAAKKSVVLRLEYASTIAANYLGDPARIRQVILNLVGNAIKFTPAGEVVIRVSRSDGPGPQPISITVVDTGIGMSKSGIEKLFHPFVQAESSTTRRFGGNGLGLVISRHLVRMMGGEIDVDSALGVGSSFHVVLPLERATSSHRPALAAPDSPSVVAQPLRILLVEDFEDNAMLVRSYLKGSPHRLDVAVDGREAVSRFEAEPYDLVLMDIQMPVLDGYAATREIRSWETEQGRPRVRVLALTADAMPEDAAKSLSAGCDGHLTKPIRKQTLLAAIAATPRLESIGIAS